MIRPRRHMLLLSDTRDTLALTPVIRCRWRHAADMPLTAPLCADVSNRPLILMRAMPLADAMPSVIFASSAIHLHPTRPARHIAVERRCHCR